MGPGHHNPWACFRAETPLYTATGIILGFMLNFLAGWVKSDMQHGLLAAAVTGLSWVGAQEVRDCNARDVDNVTGGHVLAHGWLAGSQFGCAGSTIG